MKHDRRGEWMSDVGPGHMLLVVHDAPLYPQSMWTALADNDTWIMSMPVLSPGDKIVVVDVLDDDRDPDGIRAFAALVVTHLGIGCVLLLSEHFRML